jgi:hypothetical protein
VQCVRKSVLSNFGLLIEVLGGRWIPLCLRLSEMLSIIILPLIPSWHHTSFLQSDSFDPGWPDFGQTLQGTCKGLTDQYHLFGHSTMALLCCQVHRGGESDRSRDQFMTSENEIKR